MPFDVYTAMGALVRAEASRTAAPAGAAPSTAEPPAGAPGCGEPPAAGTAARARRRPSALRRLAARLG
ncbi:hypothetical protein [Kitasatospora sp. NPDC091207]|uniref:hypothetical protein n=1 Tax=Kitasatospora sp. NPDC091207 TaxID=3364083 RepID=UPI00382CD682